MRDHFCVKYFNYTVMKIARSKLHFVEWKSRGNQYSAFFQIQRQNFTDENWIFQLRFILVLLTIALHRVFSKSTEFGRIRRAKTRRNRAAFAKFDSVKLIVLNAGCLADSAEDAADIQSHSGSRCESHWRKYNSRAEIGIRRTKRVASTRGETVPGNPTINSPLEFSNTLVPSARRVNFSSTS